MVKRTELTKALAREFFDVLEDNERKMGEYAAIGVTLSEFGFEEDDCETYSKLASMLGND